MSNNQSKERKPNMKKRFISIALVIVVIISTLVVPVVAASSKTVYLTGNCSWSGDVKCTLSKNIWGNPKSGKVRVSIANWGVNVDIRMRYNGKVIWSENNAIRSSGSSAEVYRDFYLGNDHTYYNLSFRCSRSVYVAPYVTVKNLSNCSIS